MTKVYIVVLSQSVLAPHENNNKANYLELRLKLHIHFNAFIVSTERGYGVQSHKTSQDLGPKFSRK